MTQQLEFNSQPIDKPIELTSQLTTKNQTTIALAALFPVLIIVAAAPILIKLSEYEVNPNTIMFNRLWMALPTLGCWNGILRFKEKWTKNPNSLKFFPQERDEFLLLLLLGVLSGGHQLLYAWSLTQTSAANAEVLHSITPIFIAFAGWIFLSQQFKGKFILGMVIAICGSSALVVNDLSITLDKLQGDGLAVISAILWSGYLLILEKLQTQFSINIITTWTYLVGTVLLFPILLLTHDGLFPNSWEVWLIIGVLGNLGILNRVFLTYSLKRLPSALVATILLLHPIITAILAWGIFSETLNLLNGLAFFVILLGVYLAISSQVEFSQSD
ncbi:MAG: DMT family transporter [Cyanobacteria bacterium J06592_8]